MHEKRYQIFISSTFEDLKQERRAVEEAIISSWDFPVQMEAFPAADEDQFEFIKALIDKCDYYVLIVAGRYGTVTDDGLSYTEKEYRYAVSKGVPVLVMLHSDRGSIRSDLSEHSEAGKEKLEKFITEVSAGRIRKQWHSVDSLKLAVREAIDYAKATKPRTGWVRGDAAASVEILEEINKVRKENQSYKDALGKFDIPLPQVPNFDEDLEFELIPVTYSRDRGTVIVRCSWISLFSFFYRGLAWASQGRASYSFDSIKSRVAIGSMIAGAIYGAELLGQYKINQSAFERRIAYYIESDLMEPEGAEEPFLDTGKRYARRLLIAGVQEETFSIIRGEISDEIPF